MRSRLLERSIFSLLRRLAVLALVSLSTHHTIERAVAGLVCCLCYRLNNFVMPCLCGITVPLCLLVMSMVTCFELLGGGLVVGCHNNLCDALRHLACLACKDVIGEPVVCCRSADDPGLGYGSIKVKHCLMLVLWIQTLHISYYVADILLKRRNNESAGWLSIPPFYQSS